MAGFLLLRHVGRTGGVNLCLFTSDTNLNAKLKAYFYDKQDNIDRLL